jgi:hypothetical protein
MMSMRLRGYSALPLASLPISTTIVRPGLEQDLLLDQRVERVLHHVDPEPPALLVPQDLLLVIGDPLSAGHTHLPAVVRRIGRAHRQTRRTTGRPARS